MTAHYLHGDSRQLILSDVGPSSLFSEKNIDLIVTDPPYGMDFRSNFGKGDKAVAQNKKIAGDSDLGDALQLFQEVMELLMPNVAEEAEMYVFGRWMDATVWRMYLMSLPGFVYKNQLIWNKGKPGLGDLEANWASSYEVIHYLKRGRRPLPRRRSSILSFDTIATTQMIHPTEKPVNLFAELIEMSKRDDSLMVDPFAGSGASVLAAKKLGVDAWGAEMDDEHYAKGSARFNQPLLDF